MNRSNPTASNTEEARHVELPVQQLEPHHRHSTTRFVGDAEDLLLQESVQEVGVLVPLVVHQLEPDRCQIVDGYRRYRVAQRLGLSSLPCSVLPRLSNGDFFLLQFQLNTTHHTLPEEKAQHRQRVGMRQLDQLLTSRS